MSPDRCANPDHHLGKFRACTSHRPASRSPPRRARSRRSPPKSQGGPSASASQSPPHPLHPAHLIAGVLPGIERQPRKKLEPNAEGLLGLLHRWRDEAIRAGEEITRIAVAFEAGRDGFWLARWLDARGVG